MKPTEQQKTREQMAWVEAGHTAIRPGAAWFLVLMFLGAIYAVPLHQHGMEWQQARTAHNPFAPVSLELLRTLPDALAPLRDQGPRLSALLDANRRLLAAINDYEDRVEDESEWGQLVRPRLQTLFSRHLGVGNEQAYVGRDGWLFFRPGVDYVTGPGFLDPRQLARRAAGGSEWQAAPHPDPRPAILDFHQQLAQRGIELILMPVPVKASIHPGQFSSRFNDHEKSLQNISYASFIEQMREAGVTVFEAEAGSRRPEVGGPYLKTDTHWRPETMNAVAEQLAEKLRPRLATAGSRVWRYETIEHAALGDITLMLDLPANQIVFPPERVTLNVVTDETGQFWQPSAEAEVLVLGDSFSNIYSVEAMGWGESAGFVEHLSRHLGAPVDRIARNDSGAFATRERLSRDLARGMDRLAGKRLVVWQFAARELAVGDWRLIPMEKRDPPPARFFVPASGETTEVSGLVQRLSRAPRPGTVPYKDHIIALHVTDLPGDLSQAVVYLPGMLDNVWTSAARLREGDRITLRVRPWSDVAHQYDGINRSELDDFDLQLQEPCWGEMIQD